MKFRDLPRDEKTSIEFLQEHGIIQRRRICKQGHEMKLHFGKENFWRCEIRGCQKAGLRVGNWFENTRLPFEKVICFWYSWAYELTSIKWCERELEIDHETAVDYNSFMRQICHDVLWRTSGVIGGPGCTVEVDESAYTQRKYNKGRLLPTTWVIGGICRESRDVFIEVVEKRNAATLQEAIERRIHPESIIITDTWKGYSGLERNELTLTHLTVNHSKNFVNPETGAHTNTVERMWRSSKKRNKVQSGTARHHLCSYLEEFWWRNSIKDKDPFIEILSAISELYEPKIVC